MTLTPPCPSPCPPSSPQIELLNRKILWLNYRDCMSSAREAKEKLEEARSAHKKMVDELKEDDRPLILLEQKVDKLKGDRDAANRALNQAISSLVSSHSNAVDRAKLELDEAVERKAELVNESQERTKKLQSLKQALEKLKKEVSEIPRDPPPELIERDRSLKNQHQVLWSNIGQADDELNEARDKGNAIQRELTVVQDKLSRLSDPREQRMRAMEHKRRGIIDILSFVNNNKASFRGPVHGPVGLEINTRPEYAAYVEAQIGFNNLFVFVVSCRQDEEALSSFIKSLRLNASFQVASVGGTSNLNSHPAGPASQFARVGVECSLDEVIDAPDLVKTFLNDVTKFNMAYVCKDKADLEAVQREMKVRRDSYTLEISID